MKRTIDTSFDVYSDTPAGKDPDRFSSKLRTYHQILWSKALPDGTAFELSVDHSNAYLHHLSARGEFFLSSDAFTHTYRNVKAMAPVVRQVPETEVEEFFSTCSTIGAFIIFPSQRVNGQATINGARGLNWRVKDRSDLTLECIRRHYAREESPLSDVLRRYEQFFALFESFEGYVEFFLLQDLVSRDHGAIEFFLPFDDFRCSPLPANVEEYRTYMAKQVAFVDNRNHRIAKLEG